MSKLITLVVVLAAFVLPVTAQTGTCGSCPFVGACPSTPISSGAMFEDHQCEDFSGQDWTGQTCGNCDFTFTDLTDFTAQGAFFAGTDFSVATAVGCNFSSSDLTGATAFSADFSDAFFWATDLSSAVFNDTDLTGASFWLATLTGADLATSTLIDLDCRDIDAQNSFWSAAGVTGDFTGADLAGAEFFLSSVSGTFDGATLTGMNAPSGSWAGVDFSQASVGGTNFSASNLAGCNFSGAGVGGVDFSGATLTGADLSGENLSGCDLSGANVRGVDFTGAAMNHFWSGSPPVFDCETIFDDTGCFDPLADGWDFAGPPCSTCGPCPCTGYCTQTLPFGAGPAEDHRCEDLSSLVNNNADLSAGLLTNVDLSGTSLRNSNLEEADFTGADLTLADLFGSFIADADFSEATMNGIDMEAVTSVPMGGEEIETGGLFKNAKMGGARLVVANLSNCKMIGADLQGAELTLANMTNVDATGANFTGATLSGANLTNATLKQADMTNTGMFGATVTNADFSSTNFTGALGLSTTNFATPPIYDCATDFTATGFDPIAAGWTELAGPIVDLGGGCGGGGTLTVSGLSLMGQPLTFDLTGADPVANDARLAFNFVDFYAPFGDCIWMVWQPSPAFRIDTDPVNGVDQVVLPLPCSNSLSGISVNAQWNVFPTTASPWVLPNFSLSNIVRFTLGGSRGAP